MSQMPLAPLLSCQWMPQLKPSNVAATTSCIKSDYNNKLNVHKEDAEMTNDCFCLQAKYHKAYI